MKKTFILTSALIISILSFAQNSERTRLKGFNFGVGIPIECYDLKAAGTSLPRLCLLLLLHHLHSAPPSCVLCLGAQGTPREEHTGSRPLPNPTAHTS